MALALCATVASAQQTAPVPATAPGTVSVVIRTPADLLAVAGLLHDARNYTEAFRAATRLYRIAKTREMRFRAAMIAADSAAGQRRFTAAKLWLRRADQNAATGGESDLVAKLYRVISRNDPLSLSFGFSVTPSSNVNNGADTTIIEIGGLPFSISDAEQKLGGVRADASATFVYRIALSKVQRTDVLASVFSRKVWLDSAARVKAPDATGSDFDQAQVVAGLRQQRLIWPDLGPTSGTALVGRSWYGHELLSDWTQFELGQTIRQGKNTAWNVSVGLRREFSAASSQSDVTTKSVALTFNRLGASGRGYALTAFARDASSDAATLDYASKGLAARLGLGRIGKLEPGVRLTAEARDYRKWVVTAGGRLDRSLGIGLDLGFPDARYYGFVPHVLVDARRVWSDVDIYSRNEVSAALTVRSRF